MITQLVGQGDALKDGAETGKEVVKRAGQTAAIGVAGVGMAYKGAKFAGAVGSKVYNSKTGKAIRGKANELKDAAKGKLGDGWDKVTGALGDTAIGGAIGGKVANIRKKRADKKLERDMFESYREKGFKNAELFRGSWTDEQVDRFAKFNKRQDAKDKIMNAGGAIKNKGLGAVNFAKNLKNDKTLFNDGSDGKPKGLWNQFAEAGQDFNKLVANVTGYLPFYKQMEGDDAVPGGDDGAIHQLHKSIFKFSNDKEKGKEQTEREAKAYAAANIKDLIRALGHEYYMRDRDGNIIRDEHNRPQTVTGLATMNVNADNINMDNHGNMTSNGPQRVDISSMPEVRLDADTKIKIDDTKLTELYRNTGFIANTEASILKRLDDIAKALGKGGGSGSGGGSNNP